MRRFVAHSILSACVPVLFVLGPVAAEDTFSIVAVDPATGEVGSAGASCISGSIIISDVHPGLGVIHTQSYWNAQNQAYARALMDAGVAPDAIIDSLVAHDATGRPDLRQYGVVDLIDGGRAATYTGSSCIDWAGGEIGVTYAVQGNILLGGQIVDDMEAAFLETPGPLTDRLMASLQAANVPGADTRCMSDGKPAISAFIRVARPGDSLSDLYLDLNVNNTSPSQNPIDRLQILYDDWQTVDVAVAPGARVGVVLHQNRPNPFNPVTTFRWELDRDAHVTLAIYDVVGREVVQLLDEPQSAGPRSYTWNAAAITSGVYAYRLTVNGVAYTRRLALVR